MKTQPLPSGQDNDAWRGGTIDHMREDHGVVADPEEANIVLFAEHAEAHMFGRFAGEAHIHRKAPVYVPEKLRAAYRPGGEMHEGSDRL